MNWLPGVIAFSAGWAIPLVQYVLRPRFGHHHDLTGLFLDSAPDLIAAFCFPFSILIRPTVWSRETCDKLFCIFCLIALAADFYVEYRQPIGRNIFDPNDLLFGLAGTLFAAIVYFVWLRKRLVFGLPANSHAESFAQKPLGGAK